MIELRRQFDSAGPSADLVRRLRPGIPHLVEGIVSQIQREVPAYGGPASGRRHRLITMAVTAAITHFLDMIEGKPDTGRRVDDLFRRMGYGEAMDGNELTTMRSAFRIANRDSWDSLRAVTTENEASADVLGQLGDALFGYLDHLVEQATIGFEGAQRARDHDIGSARARLMESLLSGANGDDIRAQASTAGWQLPALFIAMSATFRGTFPSADELRSSTLIRAEESSALIICDAADGDEVAEELQHSMVGIRIARSWPVPMDEVGDACRWTTRALRLVHLGVIPPAPVINCAEHSTQLWLHSEPALRRRRCQKLLRPLLDETPNSREILSETLLAWLESRDSAPVIAARLGVHPQTVRYRWKRINELFGDNLRDSEFVVQVTMLLKASIPLWRAGDQSDFERFGPEEDR